MIFVGAKNLVGVILSGDQKICKYPFIRTTWKLKMGIRFQIVKLTRPAELQVRLPGGRSWRKTYFFSSRKDVKPQRNCGALGLTFRRGGLASVGRRKEIVVLLVLLPEALAVLRLCEPFFFSFFFAQSLPVGRPTYPPRQSGRKRIVPSRNSAGQAMRLCVRRGGYFFFITQIKQILMRQPHDPSHPLTPPLGLPDFTSLHRDKLLAQQRINF